MMTKENKKGFDEFEELFQQEEKKAKERYSIADTYETETSDEPLYTLKELHKSRADKDKIIPNQPDSK